MTIDVLKIPSLEVDAERHAGILEKYKDPEIREEADRFVLDIVGHYTSMLKGTEYEERDDFMGHAIRTARTVDEFSGTRIPVPVVHAAMLHDLEQRRNSPHKTVRDAATLALAEYYASGLFAEEEKDYVAAIMNDLRVVGRYAEGERKLALSYEEFCKAAIEKGLNEGDVERGWSALSNGVVIDTIPKELWAVDVPMVHPDNQREAADTTNPEAIIIMAAEMLDHVAYPESTRGNEAKQYRAYVELEILASLAELWGFDAFGSIAARSTSRRVMHEKLGHTEAIMKAREVFGTMSMMSVKEVISKLYGGDENIDLITMSYSADTESMISELADDGAIDKVQLTEFIMTYKDGHTKRVTLRKKGFGSTVHKMTNGIYSPEKPPMDAFAATEIVGDADMSEEEARKQLAQNFLEELMLVNALRETGALRLKATKEGRQPVYVQGGEEFKNSIRLAFRQYEQKSGEVHPLEQFVQYDAQEKDFEVAKFTCDLSLDDDATEDSKNVSFEFQFITHQMRLDARTHDTVAHVNYKNNKHGERQVPSGTWQAIHDRAADLSSESLAVNPCSYTIDGSVKQSGKEIREELQREHDNISEELREAYEIKKREYDTTRGWQSRNVGRAVVLDVARRGLPPDLTAHTQFDLGA